MSRSAAISIAVLAAGIAVLWGAQEWSLSALSAVALIAILCCIAPIAYLRRLDASSPTTPSETDLDDDINELSERSDANAIAAAEVSHSVALLTSNLEAQVERLQSIADLSEALSETVKQSSSRATVTLGEAVQTRTASAEGQLALNNAIGEVRSSMDSLTESASQVTSLGDRVTEVLRIAHLIREIAGQSRILALNAGIEAAHAGDGASGFAVVAGEMRGLAGKTEESVQEVRDTLGRLQDHVSTIVAQINDSSARMQPATQELERTKRHFDGIIASSEAVEVQMGDIATGATTSSDNLDGMFESIGELRLDLQTSLAEIRKVSAQAEKLSRSAAHDNATWAVINSNSYHHAYAQLGRQGCEMTQQVFADAISSGALGEADLFDRDYQPIPGTNPLRYQNRMDAYTDEVLPALQDPLMQALPNIEFACPVDDHGYTPTHNIAAQLTGDYEVDVLRNRSKRIYPIYAKSNLIGDEEIEELYIFTYKRDIGDVLHVVSVPIYVNGNYWGGFNIGYTSAH